MTTPAPMTLSTATEIMGREPDREIGGESAWSRYPIAASIDSRGYMTFHIDPDDYYGSACSFPLTPATLHAARVLLEAAE